MDNFIIEDGVPRLPTREQRFPFTKLEVGQSFTFQLHYMQEIRGAAQHVGRKYGMKFSVRKDKELGLARCWRIA